MTPQMMLITLKKKEGQTFRLIPLVDTCPYLDVELIRTVDGFYLQCVAKEKYDTFRLINHLDDNGDPKIIKKEGAAKYKMRQVPVQANYDHAIFEAKEIEQFVRIMTESEYDLSDVLIPLPKPEVKEQDGK